MELHPLRALGRVGHAIAAGPRWVAHEVGSIVPDHIDFKPRLPRYTPLPAAALAAAKARSQGVTFDQKLTTHGNDTCEPIVFEIHGTPDQLQKALEKSGWLKADKGSVLNSVKVFGLLALDKLHLAKPLGISYDRSPMSTLSLDGKACISEFEKNNDHHQGRDHLRVFDTGKRDAQGKPILAICASRDTECQMMLPVPNTTHLIDTHLDPERDMVMADLLSSGRVKDWRVAEGKMSAADRAACDERYTTDHKGYIVSLG